MTFGSLFSGIGGLDLGLERAGMVCKWQVEIDPFCQKVLAKHWPEVKRYEDIRTVGDELERVDLIVGGFPCQPVSRAGDQRFQSDDRWLWPEYIRLVRCLRPRNVLVENTPGLLDGPMADVLRDLAACGYDAEWQGIPAASLGAPHVRDRVWIVAHAQCPGLPADLLASRGAFSQGIEGASGFWNSGWVHESPRQYGRWLDAAPEARVAAFAWEHAACEPVVLGVPDGVSRRMDRIKSLGNAVVPQVAEWIGRRIMEAAV